MVYRGTFCRDGGWAAWRRRRCSGRECGVIMIRQWADRLCDLEVDRKIVGLHVVDTVAAFLAGRSTAEGKALAGLCGPDASISEQAAMIAGIARLTECDDIH